MLKSILNLFNIQYLFNIIQLKEVLFSVLNESHP